MKRDRCTRDLLALVMVSLCACAGRAGAPRPDARPDAVPPRDRQSGPRRGSSLLARPFAARQDRPARGALDRRGPTPRTTTTAFDRMEAWVDSLHVGGLIVSVGSPLDIAAKLNRLQGRSALPLLIASDLEGGTGIRLNGGTPFPPIWAWPRRGATRDAYEMGRITALEGRAVGMHLALRAGRRRQQQSRQSRSSTPVPSARIPAAVGRLVAAEVRGLQENGVLATAKHFPGHGDTGTDSHIVAAGDRLRAGPGSTRWSWCPSAARSRPG